MKMLILVMFVISYSLVQSFQIQSNIFKDFANQCASEIGMSMGRGNNKFVRIGKKYYHIEGAKKVSWYAAAHYCRTLDANLATIESEDEMTAISNYLLSNGYTTTQYFWTSGNDLDIEGRFQWLGTGQPMYYSKWSIYQPDNHGGNENCVFLWFHTSEFYMNDDQCDKMEHYICEANTPKISITVW